MIGILQGPRSAFTTRWNQLLFVMTRWNMKDLTGNVIKNLKKELKSDQWEVHRVFPSDNAHQVNLCGHSIGN